MGKRRAPKPNPVKLVGGTYPDEILEKIESDPGFIRMMEQSDRDERAGRFVSHDEVVRRMQAKIEAERRATELPRQGQRRRA